MNLTSHDLNSPTGITQMSEALQEQNPNQPLTTTTIHIDIPNEEKHLLSNHDSPLSSNQIENVPLEISSSIIGQKQKSLISVYDNSTDGEQLQIISNSLPSVGILGRNKRSHAFKKRLLLSGFPKPILCDINSIEVDPNDKSNYVSHETFYHLSPTIILLTDNRLTNFEHLFHHDKQQILIDTREIISKYFSKKNSSIIFSPIPGSYRAFGNLSNWEIEHGTQRIGVAIEQSSPLHLIKFINDLNCFSHGIYFIDQYSYNHTQIKSFRNCLFPFLSTFITFSLCFILSMIEYRNYSTEAIFSQASSITASTSSTLLALVLLIRPILELIEFIFNKNLLHVVFIRCWLQSRRYLVWYSLSFAILHLIFSKNSFNQNLFFYPFLLGLFTLILLCILSFVYFPWISERLLWPEYYLLTSFLGPITLLMAFIHVCIQWKYDYEYQRNFFQLKYLSMILPLIVLLLRFIIYGIIYPINKLIKWMKNR